MEGAERVKKGSVEDLPDSLTVYLSFHSLVRAASRPLVNFSNLSRESIRDLLSMTYPGGYLFFDEAYSEYKLVITPKEPDQTIALRRIRDAGDVDYWKATSVLTPDLKRMSVGKEVKVKYELINHNAPIAVQSQ